MSETGPPLQRQAPVACVGLRILLRMVRLGWESRSSGEIDSTPSKPAPPGPRVGVPLAPAAVRQVSCGLHEDELGR